MILKSKMKVTIREWDLASRSFCVWSDFIMKKVTELTAGMALPLAEAAGCTLWDVEYVREAGTWYLRVFLDAPEGSPSTSARR